ncbi:MAG TPA: tRNA pseudouridine(55) synthase TruB [Thermoclostridium sp.]|nr:tRNA pseudouridine(55) synthase TruB [Clostridiaceae bacterium]HOQ76156.1 tRNA pseudouridine(55) synthase TruB [Thermoclostridium sp.]HPU44875.1 tRNA pseudouridine(55) synthase TruB [Thermoclostridium sp.]
MHGILNINKPSGMTSFGVIRRLRGILKTRKIGHAGTLDPDATGVLPVCAGKATKIIEFLMEKDKSYHVVMRLGIETDTQDASGEVLARRSVASSDEEISEAICSFVGDIMQVPPMYSAVRVDGKRLYELARRGVEIERKPRPVTISAIENLTITREGEDVRASFDVTCSRGTYIRTLCADIGSRLGCGAHMERLVRTRSGPFSLKDAITLEEVEERAGNGTLQDVVIGMDMALTEFPGLTVDENQAARLGNGVAVPCPASLGRSGELVRIYNEEGSLIAIGKIIDRGGKPMVRSQKWLGGQ